MRLRPCGDSYTFGAGTYAMRQMHVPTALALVHLQDHAGIAGWMVEEWVQAVLEALDIHMADVSPSNIAFLD